MSAFDRLHPAIQHHIVNSLGWRALRPLQEAAIEPVLGGAHALLLAPTAGGKTEAAFFPLLSRILGEPWSGLSALYLCPIKALLNNLEVRLQHYAGLVGRRVDVWHGDVAHSARRRIVMEPPDVLLLTPESLEVMLVSRLVEHRRLFGSLQACIVDEIHAFAGDDRGWHLLSVLERVQRLAGRTIQRLGLSATVGNPDALMDWLAGSSDGRRAVVNPPAEAAPEIEVQADYVGNLINAAVVISRMHRGEKRLVFCDSRRRVEELAAALRGMGTQTFVSHSSLSAEQRRQAEASFAGKAGDAGAVIVATSTLELGIDVGDLDRVIQIDAPATVAGFLQRVGRTGRRPGARRNCLFLATDETALLRTAALLHLWSEGYVESIEPPPLPYNVLAQQLMALTLQEGGIGTKQWRNWIGAMPGFSAMPLDAPQQLIEHMLAQGVLVEDQGLLSIGRQGESRFGVRNFLELFSVFISPPVFTVLHGRTELGHVHPLSFAQGPDGRVVITLGGINWRVKHIDWPRRQAFVEPTALRGTSKWLGPGPALRFEMARAVAAVLATDDRPGWLTKRGATAFDEARAAYDWVTEDATALVTDPDGKVKWWTFAGRLFNAAAAAKLAEYGWITGYDDYTVSTTHAVDPGDLKADIQTLLNDESASLRVPIPEELADELKFAECVPEPLLYAMLHQRLDVSRALTVLRRKRPLQVHLISERG